MAADRRRTPRTLILPDQSQIDVMHPLLPPAHVAYLERAAMTRACAALRANFARYPHWAGIWQAVCDGASLDDAARQYHVSRTQVWLVRRLGIALFDVPDISPAHFRAQRERREQVRALVEQGMRFTAIARTLHIDRSTLALDLQHLHDVHPPLPSAVERERIRTELLRTQQALIADVRNGLTLPELITRHPNAKKLLYQLIAYRIVAPPAHYRKMQLVQRMMRLLALDPTATLRHIAARLCVGYVTVYWAVKYACLDKLFWQRYVIRRRTALPGKVRRKHKEGER